MDGTASRQCHTYNTFDSRSPDVAVNARSYERPLLEDELGNRMFRIATEEVELKRHRRGASAWRVASDGVVPHRVARVSREARPGHVLARIEERVGDLHSRRGSYGRAGGTRRSSKRCPSSKDVRPVSGKEILAARLSRRPEDDVEVAHVRERAMGRATALKVELRRAAAEGSLRWC